MLEAGETYQIPLSINPPGNYLYAWTPSTGLSCSDCPNPATTPEETITYNLTIADENNCVTTDSIRLRVIQKSPDLYAPTVFSPDNNGENDYFILFGDPDAFSRIEYLQIFDRWGNLLFTGTDLPLNDEFAGWNGMYRGKMVEPGVYGWLAKIRLASGTVLFKSGDVTVVR